jgi:hypothetical protein
MNETMNKTRNQRTSRTIEALCRRCRFHPVSPRIAGYCSWDCYDADEEGEDADGEGEGERRLDQTLRSRGDVTSARVR